MTGDGKRKTASDERKAKLLKELIEREGAKKKKQEEAEKEKQYAMQMKIDIERIKSIVKSRASSSAAQEAASTSTSKIPEEPAVSSSGSSERIRLLDEREKIVLEKIARLERKKALKKSKSDGKPAVSRSKIIKEPKKMEPLKQQNEKELEEMMYRDMNKMFEVWDTPSAATAYYCYCPRCTTKGPWSSEAEFEQKERMVLAKLAMASERQKEDAKKPGKAMPPKPAEIPASTCVCSSYSAASAAASTPSAAEVVSTDYYQKEGGMDKRQKGH